MEKLNELLANAQRYMDQLTRRERLMVTAAGTCFVLFVFSIAFTSLQHSITRHELSIDEKMGNLQKVAVYAQSYAAKERQRKETEMKLGGPPVQLMSELSNLAKKRNLNVGTMGELPDQKIGQIQEKLVEMAVNEAPLDSLTDLLNDIEHDPKVIKVRKLRIRRSAPGAETLNAILTVGSYQLLAKGGKEP